jgi:malonate-semialdehyde dehydrogenase (acetylating)/methylmalonate-semialdehyde dehydrogenase
VLPDAKLDQAVPAIIASAFGAAGERCLAGSVVVAVGGVADELVRRLDTAAGGLRLGSGLDSATGMGPVIRADHRERVRGYIARGKAQGASVVRDGTANGDGNEHAGAAPDPDGFFLAPTIFDHVTPEMDIAREEIFGPVLSVVRVETLEEGIAVANRSRFGNAASIFTTSGAAARTFRERIEAGMLGVNVGVAAPLAFFPFAGWKNSFYGDLHATGKDAIAFYTDQKVITSRW